ncbi:hypothetical protein ABZ436_23455 [Micromonospora matsumotoense]|uniref:hypothetical protein n=1 Tax=Micromonospora matsumotoense TaxID=121616 RepID=UPI0033C6C333
MITSSRRRLALIAGAALLAVSVTVTATRWPGPEAEAAMTHQVGVAEYRLGDTAFTDPPAWPSTSELTAVVHYPKGLRRGKAPLIMQLHGQQYACATDGATDWPCPPGVKPVLSYRGYDYLGEALARRGFVVVSLSANGINAMMGTAPQRAKLINQHLAMWQRLSANGDGPLAGQFRDPDTGAKDPVDFRGRVDLSRVGTMGHSVAGQGVMRQASDKHRGDWPPGVTIRAVVPVASVYFEETPGDVLITRIPYAVLGATCWSGGEQRYYERARGLNRVPVYLASVQSGNHNFFNTVWSPSRGEFASRDDSDCPTEPNRPNEESQRAFAVAYLTAYYEWTLRDDRRHEDQLTGARPFEVPGVTAKIEYQPPAR